MRTYVRVKGLDPACRRRLVLRFGGAAGRPEPAGQGGDRRAGRGDGRQLRGEGEGGQGRDGRRASAPAVPRGGLRQPGFRLLREGKPRAVRDLRGHGADRGGSGLRGGVPRRERPRADLRHARADRARAALRVREELSLPISVGVARTRVLAKLASKAAKPDGLVGVDPERELEFLMPLRVEAVWGIGDATARKLHPAGIHTVRDAAQRSFEELTELLGPAAGRYVYAVSRNREFRRVRRSRGRRSFGAQSAMGRSPKSAAKIDARLLALADRITRRMRAKGRTGRTVVLRLRWSDYTRASRSKTLPRATSATAEILAVARELMAAAGPEVERRGLTLVGLTITNLDRHEPVQTALPVDGEDDRLDAAVDDVRERFGTDAVTRGTLVDSGRGRSTPG